MYQWLATVTKLFNGTMGIPYETAQPYIACSQMTAEISERGDSWTQPGFCGAVNLTCSYMDIAWTCDTFPQNGGTCTGLTSFPNATVVDYGWVHGAHSMMKEILHRGQISMGSDAELILNYTGGIVTSHGNGIDHVIEVVGWGTDPVEGKHWHVRNSCGEYWGEMVFVRVKFGALIVDKNCNWAVPGSFTTQGNPPKPCYEYGSNCAPVGDDTGPQA